jgi:four helix bundle protein
MVDDGNHGYRKLRVYQLAHDLGDRVHAMTLTLPYFEHRETGSQIRRSSKSVSAQIVEGYKLRKYRDEFLHYLHRAAASAEETREHLSYLLETGSLKDIKLGKELDLSYAELSGGLARFIMGIERDHSRPFYLRASDKPPPKAEIRRSPSQQSKIRNPLPQQSETRNPPSQQSAIRNPKSPQ